MKFMLHLMTFSLFLFRHECRKEQRMKNKPSKAQTTMLTETNDHFKLTSATPLNKPVYLTMKSENPPPNTSLSSSVHDYQSIQNEPSSQPRTSTLMSMNLASTDFSQHHNIMPHLSNSFSETCNYALSLDYMNAFSKDLRRDVISSAALDALAIGNWSVDNFSEEN